MSHHLSVRGAIGNAVSDLSAVKIEFKAARSFSVGDPRAEFAVHMSEVGRNLAFDFNDAR
jgi:hypothetical protein